MNEWRIKLAKSAAVVAALAAPLAIPGMASAEFDFSAYDFSGFELPAFDFPAAGDSDDSNGSNGANGTSYSSSYSNSYSSGGDGETNCSVSINGETTTGQGDECDDLLAQVPVFSWFG